MGILNERRAVVTGGGRGIGLAIAEALAAEGATVILVGRSPGPLAAAAASIAGGRGRAVPADLTDAAARRTLVASVTDEIGPIDVLVNNAGIAESSPLERTGDDLWDRTLALNLTAPFHLCRLVARGMRERGWGRIVNVASTAALKGYAYTAAYCASKHGLLGMTRAIAREYLPDGVTVNAVCPGFTETEMTGRTVANIVAKTGLSQEDALQGLAEEGMMGRLVQPREVAHAVLAFVGPDSDAISGQALAVAGGAVEG